MGHFQDFPALQNDIQKSLVSTVKMANRIGAEDLGFQRTVHPDVAQRLDDASERMLGISSRLLQSAAKACAVKAPRLEDAEDVEMNWRAVVDVLDSVLEKADTAMDEYTGLVKRKDPPKSAVRIMPVAHSPRALSSGADDSRCRIEILSGKGPRAK